jgi:acetolactate synthase-1/2/3 large subunit
VGPGATNLSTGVGSAWLDCAPALVITCNVATPWLERRIQMRIDHHALFKPLTKASFPLRAGRVGASLAKALHIATNEPPGPVHLDLPEDVASTLAEPFRTSTARVNRLPDLSREIASTVSKALRKARRPLLVTGLTFTRSKAPHRLLQFVERQKIPFVSTMHSKGFLPEHHTKWAGVIGRARRTNVKAFTERADLILAVGYDPIEINYEEWTGKTPLIHISSEAAEPGAGLKFLWNKACDLDGAIDALTDVPRITNQWSTADLKAHGRALERALRPRTDGFAPHQALDILREVLPADGILSYDVGG